MKDFLKKVLSTDSPAQGAFAGTTLLLVSLWLAHVHMEIWLLPGSSFPLALLADAGQRD